MLKITKKKAAGRKVYEGESEMSVEMFLKQIKNFTGDLTIELKEDKVILYKDAARRTGVRKNSRKNAR